MAFPAPSAKMAFQGEKPPLGENPKSPSIQCDNYEPLLSLPEYILSERE